MENGCEDVRVIQCPGYKLTLTPLVRNTFWIIKPVDLSWRKELIDAVEKTDTLLVLTGKLCRNGHKESRALI